MLKKTHFLLLFTCTLLVACTCGKKEQASKVEEPRPVYISKALFHNADSLLYYAERAYLHDDPRGLYVTAMASFLSVQHSDVFPDTLVTVPIDEAEIMMLHAAELGEPEALQFIQCLDYHGHWHHSLPEQLEK